MNPTFSFFQKRTQYLTFFFLMLLISIVNNSVFAQCTTPTVASIVATAPTCTGTQANNNGIISVTGIANGSKYGIVAGTTYANGATFANATTMSGSSITINNLPNSYTAQSYTVRVFGSDGTCFTDKTVSMPASICTMPTCASGGISQINDIADMWDCGAEKMTFYLQGNYYYKVAPGTTPKFIEYSDGTALIDVYVVDNADATKGWHFTSSLSGRSATASKPIKYPETCSTLPATTQPDWYYYTGTSTVKIVGIGGLAGAEITYVNSDHDVEVGTGAESWDSAYGMGFWMNVVKATPPFDLTNDINPTFGDFLINLNNKSICCTTPVATVNATQPTCTGTNSPNNGKITITGFTTGQKYQYSSGSTFNSGSATPASVTVIPTGGIVASTLANTTGSYTVRIYDANDNTCFIDRTVNVTTVNCCTKPNAGADQTPVCVGNTPITTATLAATAVSGGAWTQSSINPTGAVVTSTTNANSGVTGLKPGIYQFIWSTSVTCSDTVKVAIPSCIVAPPCTADTLAYWDFEDCSASSNNATTGMTPTFTKLNGCTGLTVSTLIRNHSANSCQTRADGGTSICMGSSTDLTFVDNSDKAIIFSLNYPAGSVGQLSSISFQTMAPEFIDFNNSGDVTNRNNNPTLWGIRVLKNNVEILKLIDQPLSLSTFTTNNLDWSNNPAFAVSGADTFTFEILGYLPSNVAGAGIREIWDLDKVVVSGYCGTCCITPKSVTASSNSPVLQGGTINLMSSSTGGTAYSWTGPNSFTSTSQNPTITNATSAMAGVYTVTVRSSGTCTATATVLVVVNPTCTKPNAGTDQTPVCVGNTPITTATLAATAVSGGAWTQSSINPTGAVVTSTTNANSGVTGLKPGVYEFIWSISSTCSDTVKIIIGNCNNLCIGNKLLNPSFEEGITLNNTVYPPSGWDGGQAYGEGGSNIPDGIAFGWTFPDATNYTLCQTVTATVGATYQLKFFAAAYQQVKGQTVTFEYLNGTSPIAGTKQTYTVTNLYPDFSTVRTLTLAAAPSNATGVRVCAVGIPSDVNGTIKIDALCLTETLCTPPTSVTAGSNSPVLQGGTINLTSSSTGGTAYAWSGPNSFTSTLQNPNIASATNAMAGTYTVTVTSSGTCTATATTLVAITPTCTPPTSVTAGNNSPVIQGGTINLTSSSTGGTAYSWSGPNGFTSTLQNPSITNANSAMIGTYTVTVTSSGTCTAKATTFVISVTASCTPPTAVTAGSNSPISQGGIINLTSSSTGGTAYSWTGPNGFTSNSQNPSITNATNAMIGTYTVTVVSSGTCNATATTMIGALLPPTCTPPTAVTASSNSPVAQGGTINLTSSSTGGTSYAWSGPNSFASTLQNPTLSSATSAMAGTYTVTVTSLSTCTATATTLVAITPTCTPPTAVTAGSNSPVVQGGTINLTSTSTGGMSYSWSGPNSFASTLQNPSIANAANGMAGTYTVTVTSSGTCTATATTLVAITPTCTPPTAVTASSNSPVAQGGTINLTSTSTGGTSYAWSGPNGFTSTLQNPSIASATNAMAGTYTVTVTSSGTCTATATTLVAITATCTPPTAVTASSNSPVAQGGTINLTSSSTGGTSYAWSGPNSFASTLQNPTLSSATSAMAGTYTVTVTSLSTCTATATTLVAITPTCTPPTAVTAGSNSPVVQGGTINLTSTSTGGMSYSWSGPNSFASTLQNPSIANAANGMAGTYTVTVTSSGTCTATATTLVAITPTCTPPTAVTASSNSPVAQGGTINLTSTSTGGTSYAWSGPNSFASTLQNPSIASATNAMAGTYTVTVTSSGTCTATATTLVAITATCTPPTAVTASSNSPVAQGGTINLTSTSTGGTSYAWSGPNSFTSTLQNPSIATATNAMAGTYTVTVTSSGTCTATATTLVAITPTCTPPTAVTASSNSPVAEGGTLNLTSTSTGGTSYTWSGPNGFTSTLQNPSIASVTSLKGGVYTVSVLSSGTCVATATTSVVVTVIATCTPPTALTASSNSPVAEGGTINLTSTSTGGTSYSWSGPNGFSSSSQNPSIASAILTMSGTYTVTVLSSGTCTATATTLVAITATCTPPTVVTANSNSPVSQGGTINLTSSSTGGTSYAWSGPNSFASTLQNPTIATATNAMAGTYTVTVMSSGTCTVIATTLVAITPTCTPPTAVTANNNSPVLQGGTINLTSSSTGGTSYSWSGPNGFSSTLQNPTLSPATLGMVGTYTVTVMSTGTCTATATTSVISVTLTCTPPTAVTASSNSPVSQGGTINLMSSSTGGTSYAWSGPNGFSSTLQNPNIASSTSGMSGTYTVRVTSSGTCTAAATTLVSITIVPTCTLTMVVTPSVTPATCNGGLANSDAKIVFTSTGGDKYGISLGGTYTGVAYGSASVLSLGIGSLTGISNPLVTTQYTIRVFNGSNTCYTDTVVSLNPTNCVVPCEPKCIPFKIVRIRN